MLYYLFNYLDKFDFPGAGMFHYIMFRTAMAALFSLLFSIVVGKWIIRKLQAKQIGETIRDLDLEGQYSKRGTPTMGGIIIILSILTSILLFGKLENIYVILMIVSTIWLGALGFTDDYIKIFKKDKKGLKGKYKILAQIGLGLIIGITLYMSPNAVMRENTEIKGTDFVEQAEFRGGEIKSTKTTIPFVKNNNFDYRSLVSFMGEYADEAAWILFIAVVVLIVTAVSNSANLTDGLDGLASGSSASIGVALGLLAYVSGRVDFASYLNIMYIPGSDELLVFAAAFVGATVGFLWYNAYPAQVFMGDTGSLTLGGLIGVFAVLIHKELLLPILCGVFFVEALSVIVQVTYFRYTKKKYGEGKRVFKMTPLHHHFQKPGDGSIDALIQKPFKALTEPKIVTRFWLVGMILAVLALATLKMR
ncbi:MAG TPA: phospho-N-acetylmuramoyl-pentapeptide-transferase [Dysgonamonadaceae bacterium]|jgi:phospho-N-acetylmuramoyl-pentapeptide-transferase|uniref:phospho-N-acetylmuramoyl-pentapeptide- transferase n=1 Tax=Seramator thermalis TaxID=2496270 RepID=UPI000C716DF0|nr:phospho-N-acetylmuramoyl-pentapeptide-transferase [Seramator thermalis]MBP7180153.1 phospho-N-acetylmuramoyl-pentapeptide-transferase [Dysgonamonadaceae bacterium]PLB86464.1 phospho-N-acetylmuramoyl-pentapeptide-transferase [Dysgonamonadaceae bacterium]HOM62635.1 phospho-N-acetylmuramoyl-pentapeptide-transferase [Dysgonamonadaceae bacterium]HPD44055.1 phospho-N-acetylmuramoyl-pentapeptide-transferase [Dysgonamonadaceae bacterium]HQG08410.1 phospho-N-acetylmuramoyl-pentapeptide-transferase [